MELLKYDPKDDSVTMKIDSAALVDLTSVLVGAEGTFGPGDVAKLGVTRERLQELRARLFSVLQSRGVTGRG